ncbi:hypothetical protein J3454_15250 [Erythrobacter sp. NFXS35]|uniref:hypothetical protein n=1 Tax=Erythrobacter sp. NFXS35 TaxID=2818436 RepID=UPI0032DFABE3
MATVADCRWPVRGVRPVQPRKPKSRSSKSGNTNALVDGVVGGGAKQSLAFSTALSSGWYIYGIDPEAQLPALQSQVRPIGTYVATDGGSSERIAGRYAHILNAAAPDEQINELSSAAGAAGLKRFWHITISHREREKITAEQGEEIRTTFAKVMGVEQCSPRLRGRLSWPRDG